MSLSEARVRTRSSILQSGTYLIVATAFRIVEMCSFQIDRCHSDVEGQPVTGQEMKNNLLVLRMIWMCNADAVGTVGEGEIKVVEVAWAWEIQLVQPCTFSPVRRQHVLLLHYQAEGTYPHSFLQQLVYGDQDSDCSMFMDACSGLFRIGRRNWLKFEGEGWVIFTEGNTILHIIERLMHEGG
eukprot:scaffold13840_cov78-Skeletonema_dohrnii-CCMP3373.AAC.1